MPKCVWVCFPKSGNLEILFAGFMPKLVDSLSQGSTTLLAMLFYSLDIGLKEWSDLLPFIISQHGNWHVATPTMISSWHFSVRWMGGSVGGLIRVAYFPTTDWFTPQTREGSKPRHPTHLTRVGFIVRRGFRLLAPTPRSRSLKPGVGNP